MQVAAIILAALVVVGGLLWFLDRRQTPEQSDVREPVADSDNTAADGDEECCGQHYSCERDSLLTALSEGIEYYEDEELDRFAGRKAHEYSEDEKTSSATYCRPYCPMILPAGAEAYSCEA